MTQSPEYRRLVRLAAGYNRKARMYGSRGTVTADDLMVLSVSSPQCEYCGVSIETGHGSFDHAIALDRGGRNAIENMKRCCLTCQRRKFTKSPAEYMAHQDLVSTCQVCGREFQPRWAEYQRGVARTCSRSCAARKRWL
jgi:HNH endonuclease